jgi:hypothetical protein
MGPFIGEPQKAGLVFAPIFCGALLPWRFERNVKNITEGAHFGNTIGLDNSFH